MYREVAVGKLNHKTKPKGKTVTHQGDSEAELGSTEKVVVLLEVKDKALERSAPLPCSESCTVTCSGSQVFTEEDAEPAESQRAHSSVLHALTSAIRGSGRPSKNLPAKGAPWLSLNVTAHERATEDQTDMLQNPGSIGRSESQRGGCLVLNEVVARPTTELTALQHCWLMTLDFRDCRAHGLKAILLSGTEDVSEPRSGV